MKIVRLQEREEKKGQKERMVKTMRKRATKNGMERNSTCVRFSSSACAYISLMKRFDHKHNHRAKRER
jgi:hypothetical protein